MKSYSEDKKAFFMYISLIFAVAIILILFFYLFNTYYKGPSLDEPTQKSLSSQGIDASSYQSVVDSTREKVKDIEKQLLEREERLLNSDDY
ncbi:MAG: hypothetical protein ABH954_03800 [Candidatus Omnitrophota bacterium]